MLRKGTDIVIEALTELASAIATRVSGVDIDRSKLAASAAGVLALSSVAALTLAHTPSNSPLVAEASVQDGKSIFTPVRTATLTDAETSAPTPTPVVVPNSPQNPQPTPRELAASIEAELSRAGCYRGEPNGRWTAASRQAMRNFTREANARLPVDRPDAVLLALVTGNPSLSCPIACSEPLRANDACAAVAPSAKPPTREEIASLESAPNFATAALPVKPKARSLEVATKAVEPSIKEATPPTSASINEPPTQEFTETSKDRKTATTSKSKSKARLSKARRHGPKSPSLARSMKSLSRTLKLVFF